MADTATSKKPMPPRYTVNLRLGLSRNMQVFGWSLPLGIIGGSIATFLQGGTILALLGISATPVALFCLPLVMCAIGVIACGVLLRLASWNSGSKETRHAHHGVRMILGHVLSNATPLPDTEKTLVDNPHAARFKSSMHDTKKSGKSALVASASPVEMILKVTISRFGRGGLVGGVLGAAGALTAGWFFSSVLLGLVGLSAFTALVAVAYPVVLLVVGALVGYALGGVSGFCVGSFAAWASGADKAFPTYRNTFTQVRLQKIVTLPNQGRQEPQKVGAYKFKWDGSGKLELKPKSASEDLSMPSSDESNADVRVRVRARGYVAGKNDTTAF